MLFYFSGTNNSKYIAQEIAKNNHLSLVSIADEMKNKSNTFSYSLGEDESIGFVFPVYAWAPPKIVIDFIKKCEFQGYNNNYVFSVCTCEEDIGYTMRCISEYLNEKRIKLHSGFSVVMPNNYMLHNIEVDTQDIADRKLKQADITLEKINRIITGKQKNIFDLEVGKNPFIRTKLINPMFYKFVINPKNFYAEDTCIKCKLCEKICPTDNIKVDHKPKWGKTCTFCLACINRCPVRAIQYGKSTKTKGRYCYEYIDNTINSNG